MKEYKIRVNNPAHSKKIQQVLFLMGYEWSYGHTGKPLYTNRPFLHTKENGSIYYGSGTKYFEENRAEELDLSYLDVRRPVKVHLNASYTAVVHPTHVEVGCQKFEFERIKALHHQIQEMEVV